METDTVPQPLGAQVRACRVRRGLTQDDLAALAGVTQPTISAIEAGGRVPSGSTLARLRRALELDADEFAAWLESVA